MSGTYKQRLDDFTEALASKGADKDEHLHVFEQDETITLNNHGNYRVDKCAKCGKHGREHSFHTQEAIDLYVDSLATMADAEAATAKEAARKAARRAKAQGK
jgi:hypothetical protein